MATTPGTGEAVPGVTPPAASANSSTPTPIDDPRTLNTLDRLTQRFSPGADQKPGAVLTKVAADPSNWRERELGSTGDATDKDPLKEHWRERELGPNWREKELGLADMKALGDEIFADMPELFTKTGPTEAGNLILQAFEAKRVLTQAELEVAKFDASPKGGGGRLAPLLEALSTVPGVKRAQEFFDRSQTAPSAPSLESIAQAPTPAAETSPTPTAPPTPGTTTPQS